MGHFDSASINYCYLCWKYNYFLCLFESYKLKIWWKIIYKKNQIIFSDKSQPHPHWNVERKKPKKEFQELSGHCKRYAISHFQGWKNNYFQFSTRPPPLDSHVILITETGFIPMKFGYGEMKYVIVLLITLPFDFIWKFIFYIAFFVDEMFDWGWMSLM